MKEGDTLLLLVQAGHNAFGPIERSEQRAITALKTYIPSRESGYLLTRSHGFR